MLELNEDQQALQGVVREFARSEVAPIADEIDQAEERIPDHLIKQMAGMGMFGVLTPTELGGAGLDAVSYAIITEELSAAWLSVGSVIARNANLAHMLALCGTEAQRERYVPLLASGEWQSASAGTEPEAGSDAGNIKTRATAHDGGYLLNGAKAFCTFADKANLVFTFVRTGEAKHGGISLVLVEKEPGDDFVPPTLTGTRMRTVGYHGMNTYMLHFDDHFIAGDALVGGVEGQGFYQLMKTYEVARMQFAFRCIGLARGAYEAALRYAQERVQFGSPIAAFQAVRFKLANMATEIEAARQLGYLAAAKIDRGERCDLEAGMAKLYASEMALRHSYAALEIHGGAGYLLESPAQRFWRDAGLLPIGEGTSDIQREVIARRILGERS